MKRIIALATLCALSAGLLLPTSAGAQAAGPEKVLVTSSADGIKIDITVYKPAVASSTTPVPVVLFSHGWAGNKDQGAGRAAQFNDAGIGYVTISQRGHGDSEGEANVQDPDLETEDIQSVIDYIATLDWVKKDVNALGVPIANDPVLGAIGGSYGGGYQTMTALDEIGESLDGKTRFNALSPEITWYDLNESLAPQGVPRTAWTTLLYAVGAQMLPQYIHVAFAYGAASGQWPNGTVLGVPAPVPNLHAEFYEHSPKAFADRGFKLNIPILARQGINDTLFNLNQGLHIFDKALTPTAQSQSLFVGYNGGHVLPAGRGAFPPGTVTSGDACSGDWNDLQLAFFQKVFAGENPSDLLPARYNLTDVSGAQCHRFGGTTSKSYWPTRGLDPTGSDGMVATSAGGPPIHLELNTDPNLTVVGIPRLKGEAYFAAADARVFFGLSMGTSPADAKVIQDNLMPLRLVTPNGISTTEFDIELPGVAVEVPVGQKLFLTITPIADIFFGHGSRNPSGVVMTNLELILPLK